MSALILAYYSTRINLYSPITRYNNDAKDLQKTVKVIVALRYPLEKMYVPYKTNTFILSYSILDWFDLFTCQS